MTAGLLGLDDHALETCANKGHSPNPAQVSGHGMITITLYGGGNIRSLVTRRLQQRRGAYARVGDVEDVAIRQEAGRVVGVDTRAAERIDAPVTYSDPD